MSQRIRPNVRIVRDERDATQDALEELRDNSRRERQDRTLRDVVEGVTALAFILFGIWLWWQL